MATQAIGWIPVSIPLKHKQGNNLCFTVTLKQNGTAIDLTGCTFLFVVQCAGCTDVITATGSTYISIVGAATNGVVQGNIPGSITANLKPAAGNCTHEFKVTFPNGFVWTPFNGPVVETQKDQTT